MSQPITSMTGFARVEHSGPWGTLTYEIRTINHRYLDAFVRLPEVLRSLEGEVRDKLRQVLSRGKVELHVHFHPQEENMQMTVNQNIAKAYVNALMEVKSLFSQDIRINLCDVLSVPGVLTHTQMDLQILSEPFMQGLNNVLKTLQTMRMQEGATLKSLLQTRCEAIKNHVVSLKPHLQDMMSATREKLINRLNQAAIAVDENRVEQEMVIWASRTDVAEEMDRLLAHVDAVNFALNEGGAVGRRLDFLMQELNREANTLSSKSQSLTSTNSAVEMKVLIEQMREQIQNME